MRLHLLFLVVAGIAQPAFSADWLTAPSYYTHDHSTGERVAQYSQIGPFYYYLRPDYLKSGYRQYRSTIDLGNSSDNMHIVEEWGRPVRPYEEWQFPYRPYSVPYQAWGPPYGGLGGGTGFYPYGGGFGGGGFGGSVGGMYPYSGGGGFGGGFGGGPGFPGGFNNPAVNYAQPWLDGHYPNYNFNDRSQYWRPYVAPTGPVGPVGPPGPPGPPPGPPPMGP
jgi:hypothetical protein